MKKNIKQTLLEIAVALSITVGCYFYILKYFYANSDIFIEATFIANRPGTYELFYQDGWGYTQEESSSASVEAKDSFQTFRFQLPINKKVTRFRFDFENKRGIAIIKQFKLYTADKSYIWSGQQIINDFIPNTASITETKLVGDHVEYKVENEDPYIELKRDIVKEYTEIRTLAKRNKIIPTVELSLLLFFIIFACIRITGFCEKMIMFFSEPQKVLMALFLLILFLPLANMIFELFPEEKNYEKRALNEKPTFDIKHFSKYTENYNSYFNDHFGFRNLLIKSNSYFKFLVFHSIARPDIVPGKKNWLYPIEILDPLPLKELNGIEKNIEEISVSLKEKGIDYYLIPAPEKSYIYPENISDHYKKTDFHIRMDQLITRLSKNKNIKIIDVRNALLSAKDKRELYYPSDTHWNMYGAMVAYTHVLAELKKYYPDIISKTIEDYDFEEVTRKGGDISYLLNAPELFPMKDWIPIENGKGMYSVEYIDEPRTLKYTVINNNSINNKKILVLHDSYALYWRTPFSKDFQDVTFRWSNFYDNNLVEEIKPDIVIHEFVNRYAPNLSQP